MIIIIQTEAIYIYTNPYNIFLLSFMHVHMEQMKRHKQIDMLLYTKVHIRINDCHTASKS